MKIHTASPGPGKYMTYSDFGIPSTIKKFQNFGTNKGSRVNSQ